MKKEKSIFTTIQVSQQTKALSPMQRKAANEIIRMVQQNVFPDTELKK